LLALLTQKAAAEEAEVMAEVAAMVAGEVVAAADISAEVDTAAVADTSEAVGASAADMSVVFALAVHISAARASAEGPACRGLQRAANARWRSMVIATGPLSAPQR
jgi:hypothetical protein